MTIEVTSIVFYVDETKEYEFEAPDNFEELEPQAKAEALRNCWFAETAKWMDEIPDDIPEDEREKAEDWDVELIGYSEGHATGSAIFIPYRGESATILWFD